MTNERTEQAVNELLYVTEHLSKQVEALNEQMTSCFESLNNQVDRQLSVLDGGFAKNLNKMVNHIDRDNDRLSQGIGQIVSILENVFEDEMRDPSMDDQPDGGLPLYVEASRKK